MAGGEREGKTEKPTAKRKREARREGRIARSPDLVAWLSILVACTFAPGVLTRGGAMLSLLLMNVRDVARQPTDGAALAHLHQSLVATAVFVAPILLGLAALATVVTMAQVGFILTTKPITPDLKRLNPTAGLKRLVSPASAWEAGKSLAKMTLIALVAWPVVRRSVLELMGGTSLPLRDSLTVIGHRGLTLVRTVAGAALLVAAADYAYQRRRLNQSMMMTKQEVRDEHKQSEGNPEVKHRIRSKALQASRNRMLAAVGKADVVVVNPVHIAVALRYEPMHGAPRVIAKGEGWLAEKIRDRAQQHDVPIVESIPLARTLYAAVELDHEIPVELYEAVARLLAFVHRLAGRRPLAGNHHRLPDALVG